MTSSQASTLADTHDDAGEWMHFGADPRFDYPIDYSIKILGACAATRTVDLAIMHLTAPSPTSAQHRAPAGIAKCLKRSGCLPQGENRVKQSLPLASD